MTGNADPKPLTQADIQAAVAAATAPLTAKINELEKKASAPPAKETKVYTRAELSKAVDDGTITEGQAQDILDRQNAAKTENLVKETVESTITSMTKGQTIAAQIDAYSEIVPEVLKDGSDDRKRVEAQYRYFVSIGLPEDQSTELAALNSIYGSIDALKSSKGAEREFEHHQETSGGGEGVSTPDGTNLKLSAAEKKYYQYLIDHGQMKDWKAVEEELKYANPNLRKRHARAA